MFMGLEEIKEKENFIPQRDLEVGDKFEEMENNKIVVKEILEKKMIGGITIVHSVEVV